MFSPGCDGSISTIAVYGENLVPCRNSCVNKLLYSAVDARILLWVEVVDVTRELHSPVLESQVRWQPLILIRPVFWGYTVTASIITQVRLRSVDFARLGYSFAFASPQLNRVGYPDNFFLEKV